MFMKRRVLESPHKYVLIVSDISTYQRHSTPSGGRPFADVWEQLPSQKVFSDSLAGRAVTVVGGSIKRTVLLGRGCAQGSVLGPFLWNLVFHELVDLVATFNPNKCTPVAYMNELALIIEANCRREAERTTNEMLARIDGWMSLKHLKINPEKCAFLLIRGKMNPERMPRLFVSGQRLANVHTIKYLGVILAHGLSAKQHLDHLAGILRVVWGKWHLNKRSMALIYCAVFLPIV